MDKIGLHEDRIEAIFHRLNRVEDRLNELELSLEDLRKPKESSAETN